MTGPGAAAGWRLSAQRFSHLNAVDEKGTPMAILFGRCPFNWRYAPAGNTISPAIGARKDNFHVYKFPSPGGAVEV